MATEDYWADPVIDRERTPLGLYFPTLDAVIGKGDPVRLVDEVLAGMDWSDWEFHYPRRRGQPPIRPKYLAAAIRYGMYRGIRSSRKLEDACKYRFDFIWLVEGRRIDHTTFNKFRTKFREPLKNLFKQIGRTALALGVIRLGEVAFDGTRVKANNARFQTRTAKTLQQKLEALDELFDHLMTRLSAADAEEAGLGSPTQLPDSLADIEQRRELVKAALEQARAADEARRRQGVDPEKNPAQVPTTDAGNNGAQIMHEMEERGVEFYAPVESSQPQPGNPALRDDPRQPVPESEWPNLKRNDRGQLDKSCFVYVAEEDRVALGGDGVQFDEIGARDRETARRVGRNGSIDDNMRKAGRMRKSDTTKRGPPK